jgi:hypothetical protein
MLDVVLTACVAQSEKLAGELSLSASDGANGEQTSGCGGQELGQKVKIMDNRS